jgi:hypothetical protein
MKSFQQACTSIAIARNIPYVAIGQEDANEPVQQHLGSTRAGRWLLLVWSTGADDPDMLLGIRQSRNTVDSLPENEGGVVVYTTRTLEVAVSLTRSDTGIIRYLELGAMNRPIAAEFLTKSLIRKDLLCSCVTRDRLLNELTCLPLAIAQTAAYSNINKISIIKYLQLLRRTLLRWW